MEKNIEFDFGNKYSSILVSTLFTICTIIFNYNDFYYIFESSDFIFKPNFINIFGVVFFIFYLLIQATRLLLSLHILLEIYFFNVFYYQKLRDQKYNK